MSTSELLQDIDVPQIGLADALDKPQFEQAERVDAVALTVIEAAIKNAGGLRDSIKRGRGSASADRCTTMVEDYCMHLADLHGLVTAMQAGDMEAAARIPGLLQKLKDSLKYSEILKGNKGYKKDGETVMAGYIFETIQTLSTGVDRCCDAVRPLSEAVEVEMVRMNVRKELNAVAGYKFNTKSGIQGFGSLATVRPEPKALIVDEARTPFLPVNLDVHAAEPVLEDAPFSKVESTWFESTAPLQEATPAKARSGFFSRMKAALGDLLNSAARTVPRAALAGALLSGCAPSCGPSGADSTGSSAPAAEQMPVAPDLSEVTPIVVPAPVVAQFQVADDAPNLWTAVSDELADECGLTGGPLQRETRKVVDFSFTQKNIEYTGKAEWLKEGSNATTRLNEIRADLSQYGVVLADDWNGVLRSVSQTGEAANYEVESNTIKTNADAAFASFNNGSPYTCSTN